MSEHQSMSIEQARAILDRVREGELFSVVVITKALWLTGDCQEKELEDECV